MAGQGFRRVLRMARPRVQTQEAHGTEERPPVPPSGLPQLKYFMAVWTVPESFGGMTAMALQRAGLFHRAGRQAAVLTFDAEPGYEERAARLVQHGALEAGVPIINLYDNLAALELEAVAGPPPAQAEPNPNAIESIEHRRNGQPYRRVLHDPASGTDVLREYFRPDGSVFLRDVVFVDSQGPTGARQLVLWTRQGAAGERFTHPGQLYRYWLDRLTDAEGHALIVDSAFAARFIAGWDQRKNLKVAVIHSNHVLEGSDPWTGKVGAVRKATLDAVQSWNGVVFLTERQKADYAGRFAATDNLYTVANPRERVPELPPFEARDPARGVLLSRLENGKNVDEAIHIIRLARERAPGVQLDIYGGGSLSAKLSSLIAAEGLQDCIRLHGHVTGAANEFATANFCLFPSQHEGLPLTLMESLGRGCPVVAYDIRYGPSDLISDGTTGFLVAPNDVEAAAERVVELATNSELARSMSVAAWEASAGFGNDAVIEQWARTLHDGLAKRVRRVIVSSSSTVVKRLSWLEGGRLQLELGVTMQLSSGTGVEGVPAFYLRAVPRDTGIPRDVPARVSEKSGSVCTVEGELDMSEPRERNTQLDLWLVCVWNNAQLTHRLSTGSPAPAWFPYVTVKGNLSLK